MQLAVTLIPYVSVGISLIVFLGLFCNLSRSLQKLNKRMAKLEGNLGESSRLRQGIDGLKLRMDELEMSGPGAESLGGPAAGLNGSIRSKVLKMHRLGQPSARIADSLKVPKGEVDLLVKVHQMVMRPYEQLPAGAQEGEAG